MDILALSTWLRYLELGGESVRFPPNAYQGDYVRDMAAAIAQRARRALSPVMGARLQPALADVEHRSGAAPR